MGTQKYPIIVTMEKPKIVRSFILLLVGTCLAAYAAAAFSAFSVAGSQILMLGSAVQGSNAAAQYFFTLAFLAAIFACGAALLVIAVRGIIRSFKK